LVAQIHPVRALFATAIVGAQGVQLVAFRVVEKEVEEQALAVPPDKKLPGAEVHAALEEATRPGTVVRPVPQGKQATPSLSPR